MDIKIGDKIKIKDINSLRECCIEEYNLTYSTVDNTVYWFIDPETKEYFTSSMINSNIPDNIFTVRQIANLKDSKRIYIEEHKNMFFVENWIKYIIPTTKKTFDVGDLVRVKERTEDMDGYISLMSEYANSIFKITEKREHSYVLNTPIRYFWDAEWLELIVKVPIKSEQHCPVGPLGEPGISGKEVLSTSSLKVTNSFIVSLYSHKPLKRTLIIT